MEEVLQPDLPIDAAALIAFTNEDLFPGNDFKLSFSDKQLQNRVEFGLFFDLTMMLILKNSSNAYESFRS